ncbi:MAG: DUF5989 family protein [Gemmatimonadota bacterium]|jgi:hypothetical protein|nr:DUF5989 family protein [Gemmatimonadota bacterium]MDP6803049.1 DUF5989 family protein [Gemmatimonadota bacterium]MDP7032008.1 DUF5989 family protein [Gemmatimonadota bacterium]
MKPDQSAKARRFAEQAGGKPRGMLSEFWGLLRENKKWWLTPIILAAVLLGGFMILMATPLSPLIYTLF